MLSVIVWEESYVLKALFPTEGMIRTMREVGLKPYNHMTVRISQKQAEALWVFCS